MSVLQDLADELTIRLDAPVGISDLTLAHLAAGPHPLNVDWMRRESLLSRAAPRQSQEYYAALGVRPGMSGYLHTPEDVEGGVSARWVVPARWSGRTYGYIWVIDEGGTSVPESEIAQLWDYAERIAETIHRRTSRLRDRASSVRDLLLSNRRGHLDTAGWLYDVAGYPQGPVAVLVMSLTGEVDAGNLPISILDGPLPRAVPGEVWRFVDQRRAVMLLPPETVTRRGATERVAEHAKQVTETELDAPGSVVIGIGDPVANLYEASASFRQARLAVRALTAFGHLPRIQSWSDLGALRAVVSIPDELLDDAIPPGVAMLHEESPFLAETLDAYFATGCSVPDTCQALSISRGTVYYRLQRAETISGLSLKDGADRMTLQVGLAVMRLRDSGQQTHVSSDRVVSEVVGARGLHQIPRIDR